MVACISGTERPERIEPITLPDVGYAYEAYDCPFDTLFFDEITCGYLLVPEDRTQPDGPVIELAVAVLKSYSDAPKPDPILYLEGGPGGSALVGFERLVEKS